MQSANLSGPFRGCLYYALLGLPQATGLAGGYDYWGISTVRSPMEMLLTLSMGVISENTRSFRPCI